MTSPVVVPETEEVVEGKVVYEQDLRAAAHRNGHADHLHSTPVSIGGEPPVDEPGEEDDRPERPQRNVLLSLAIATAYLGFGGLMVYAGVLVIKDLIINQKEHNE